MKSRWPALVATLLLSILLVVPASAAPAKNTAQALVLGARPMDVSPAAVKAAVARAERAKASGTFKTQILSTHMAAPRVRPSSWTEAVDDAGRAVHRLVIRAEGAPFLRPHFTGWDAGRVTMYGPQDTVHQVLVDRRVSPAANEGLWGEVVEGDTLVIDVTGDPSNIAIDQLSYGLVPLRFQVKEQPCNNDVNCDADWAERKTGVGLMYFEMFGFGSGCTGSLVADVPGTGRPWFLSANHCISTQSTTNTLVVYWNFETDTCDGTVPSLNSLPRSSGGTYTAGNAVSDFTLISLAQDPPAGAMHLPLSTDALTANEDITVVHHPDLAFKRITYGNYVSDAGTHWTVRYYSGSTEGGSSGSPLFNANNEIVGQLTGGSAACSRMWGTDRFGKISLSWNNGLSDFLSTIPTGYTTTTTTTIPGGDDDDAWHDDDSDDDAGDDDAADDDFAAGGDDDDDDDSGNCCG